MKTVIDLENIIDAFEVNKDGSETFMEALGVDADRLDDVTLEISKIFYSVFEEKKYHEKSAFYKDVLKVIINKNLSEAEVFVALISTAEIFSEDFIKKGLIYKSQA